MGPSKEWRICNSAVSIAYSICAFIHYIGFLLKRKGIGDDKIFEWAYY